MTPEEREKMWKAEVDAENAKDDANWGFSFANVFKWIGILLVISVIYVACTAVTDDNSTTTTAPPIKAYNIKEDAVAGTFTYNVSEAYADTKFGSAKTENLFVIMKIKITSNDTKPRDISKSLFKLVDSQNRTFEAFDGYYGNDSLMYDTVNPGLTATKTILFEVPGTLKGNVSLLADSGVSLAGGSAVKINLITLK